MNREARAVRAYRRLLRLLPRPVREQDGEEMAAAFAAMWAGARGVTEKARVAALSFGRLPLAALAEWRDHARRSPREHERDPRGGGAVTSDLLQDLRFALRTLARRPRFTLTAVAVLGLGIGSTSTVLALIDRIHFDPPDEVAEPDRLVRLWRDREQGAPGGALSHADYRDYREAAGTLSGLAAYDGPYPTAYSTSAGVVDQLGATFVSGNYFDVLGVRPALGRFFLPEEDATPGTHLVAVLSHTFWRRAFGADPRVVGSTAALNGHSFTVVGVAPSGFRGTSPAERQADVWVPIAAYGLLARAENEAWWTRVPGYGVSWLSVVGRLAPGATVDAARAELALLHDAAGERDPTERIAVSGQYRYTPEQASLFDRVSRMLLAVVALVLAIAAANASMLFLSHATSRSREMGIRTALGAGRGRVIRLIVTESLVLAMAGCGLGIVLSMTAGDLVGSFLPLTFATSLIPDPGVVAGTLLLSILTGTIVGLATALHATRSNLLEAVAGGCGGPARVRLHETLVVGQVALSVVLVAGAGLFARSFLAARSEPLGFETGDRLVLGVNLQSQGYDEVRGRALVKDAVQRLEALPGVVRASATMIVPFQGQWTTSITASRGAEPTDPDDSITTGMNLVAPGYFDLMSLPILRGRALTAVDDERETPAVVLNETLATAIWPGEDPLDRTVELRGTTFTVVGIARDATYYEVGEVPRPLVYGSLLQVPAAGVSFLVESAGPAIDLAPPAQAALREIDPALTFRQVTTLQAVVENQNARYELTAVLVGIFGVLALVLAASGLYAVVSFLVGQQTREIGVRIAVGASRLRIMGQVVLGALRIAALGIAFGVASFVGLRRFVGSLLYGVEPGDSWSVISACLVLTAVTLLASLAPAGRASRVDPLTAIRAE